MASGTEASRQEFLETPYTIFPEKERPLYSSEDERLGDLQEVEVFETEHHVYRVPFRYRNVKVENWLEYSEKGMEMAGFVWGVVTAPAGKTH